jgi:hypothetical protein
MLARFIARFRLPTGNPVDRIMTGKTRQKSGFQTSDGEILSTGKTCRHLSIFNKKKVLPQPTPFRHTALSAGALRRAQRTGPKTSSNRTEPGRDGLPARGLTPRRRQTLAPDQTASWKPARGRKARKGGRTLNRICHDYR